MQLFKMLNEDGSTPQGYGNWDLSGNWMPEIRGKLAPCRRGYHLLRKEDLVHWMGPALWVVEVKDVNEIIEADTKVVVRQARLVEKVETWNKETWVNFSCDCAERVLENYQKQFPDDKRIYHAIEAARYYAAGRISIELLKEKLEAARSARSAAWSAAESAWSAWSAESAAESARSAAESAAESAWSAAESAWSAESARSAELEWQTNKLLEYLKI